MNHLVLDSRVEAVLERLYAQHAGQNAELAAYFSTRMTEGSLDWNAFDEQTHKFLRNKLVALERDKAEFCYQLCRAICAGRVVEAGTSFGVSTLFLAAAVRDNLHEAGSTGLVIGTEFESEKAQAARVNFAAAGLAEFIELREGDVRETLVDVGGPVDFVLIDIWTPLARPALELIAPSLRVGAVVICDNTIQAREGYGDYFEFLHDPANGFRTMTLPFEGGLEFTIRAR